VLDTEAITIHTCVSDAEERVLADDVLDGLTKPFKEIPPKHFYDARGSELFERICELPEYYPTRTERQILEDNAVAIVEETGAAELVELGSGSAEKARILLEAMEQAGTLRRYIPLDVSEHALETAARELVAEYDGLLVDGVIGDFERHLESVPEPDGGPRIVALLGGTIGNFPPGTRRRLLRQIRRLLGPEDRLLLGTDLVKDPAVIEAAYDDPGGVTAEFNRNVLQVLNRELHADFDVTRFDHLAFYDAAAAQIEMHLRAREAHTVHITALDLAVDFAAGETIHTESSRKFTRATTTAMLAAAAFRLEHWYTPPSADFALALATVGTTT
jgi:L-histidine N-alpha-methyltransferase